MGDSGGAGADLAIIPGGSSAQGRLAVLKLKQHRLEGELSEVSALLEAAQQDAIAEMERVSKEEQARGVIRKLGSRQRSRHRLAAGGSKEWSFHADGSGTPGAVSSYFPRMLSG